MINKNDIINAIIQCDKDLFDIESESNMLSSSTICQLAEYIANTLNNK